MKTLMRKLKALIKKILGKTAADIIIPINTTKTWEECKKSSNWTGKNASKRIMNILSPNMSDGTFNDRFNFAKGRGVDHFNLFITNQKDGEAAGYSIYGPNFAQSKGIDKNSCKIMEKRIDKILDEGFGVVLWMTADDTAWNKTMNFDKLCSDVKKLGWFDKASAVVVGLECNEYWNASQVNNYCKILRNYSKKKVGVHQTSDRIDFMKFGDLAYLQINPGASTTKIQSFVKNAKAATGKPVCMFEMERAEDRNRCNAAFAAGAWSVGNY